MFPFDLDDEDVDIEEAEEKTFQDYEIDFTTGKLTGRIIRDLEAVKQWIMIVLAVDRYFYTQYDWDFGSELNTLIGKNVEQAYLESEVKRMIEDALTINEYIYGIDDLVCSVENGRLTASFSVETMYGEVDVSV